MKIPFTIVRYFSRKNTPKRGRSGSVPKPKNKGKGVDVNQVVVVGGVIPVVAEYDMDKPRDDGYSSAVDAVTNSLLEVGQIKSALELDDILRFVRFTYRNRSIDALVNRKTVKMLALKFGGKVLVVEKKENFGVIADYLRKMEGLDPEEFLYFGWPVSYSLMGIPFSLDLVRDEMTTLFEMDRVGIKKFENAMLFDSLFCFFILSSVVPKWKKIFSNLMRPGASEDVYLSEVDVNLWTHWVPISDFVCSGGVTKLPQAVDWLDLRTAKAFFAVLKPSGKQCNAPSTRTLPPFSYRGYHTFVPNAFGTRPLCPFGNGAVVARFSPVSSLSCANQSSVAQVAADQSLPVPLNAAVTMASKFKLFKLLKHLPK